MQAEQPHKKHSLRGGKRVLASETERSESDLVTASSQSRLLYQPIKGDGRCLFRAIAVGLAHRRGVALRAQQEQEEADRLRMAVADALCRSPERRASFPEAMTAVKAEGVPLRTYCKKLIRPDFWGGEAEISTIAEMLHVPLAVYVPATQQQRSKTNQRYVNIATYGAQHMSADKPPIRLLYRNGNHYDLLLDLKEHKRQVMNKQ